MSSTSTFPHPGDLKLEARPAGDLSRTGASGFTAIGPFFFLEISKQDDGVMRGPFTSVAITNYNEFSFLGCRRGVPSN